MKPFEKNMRLDKKTSIPTIARLILAREVTLEMLTGNQRLESITFLRLEGVKQVVLADLLGCSPRTIRRYVAIIRQNNQALYEEGEMLKQIGECNMIIDHETRRLMRIAATATDSNIKIKA